jgi:hypothetical protein
LAKPQSAIAEVRGQIAELKTFAASMTAEGPNLLPLQSAL